MYDVPMGGVNRTRNLNLASISFLSLENQRVWLKRKGARSPHQKWLVQMRADLRADKLIRPNCIREQYPTLRVGSVDIDAAILCF